MPNAVWTGTLSFGLVGVPVRLFPATEPKDVRFHLYDASGQRVRYQRVVAGAGADEPARARGAPAEHLEAVEEIGEPEGLARAPARQPTERDIDWEDVRRGRETETGEVVLLSREELEQVRPERSRSIDVEDFVDLADIDPVHFEKTYYAAPRSPEAVKPYVLLHRAMRETGRIGIGRFVLRTKPHLVAIRPMREVLAVETMFFGDEVRQPAAVVPGLGGVEVAERELALARQLIEMLQTEWNPDAYADTYRDELLALLAQKETVTPAEAAPAGAAAAAGSQVEQLMAALRESVEAAKRERPARTRTRAG